MCGRSRNLRRRRLRGAGRRRRDRGRIVGRGGGSIEDLWAFNEEIVARAIFDCQTPVISAVGHETDFTIADFVADLRAPTPSAAAELAVFDYRSIVDSVRHFEDRFERAMWGKVDLYRSRLMKEQMRLQYLSPESRLRENRQQLITLEDRIRDGMDNKVKEKRHALHLYLERFQGLSPLRKLNQGYSYVADAAGKAVTSITDVTPGSHLEIAVTDGMIEATVVESRKEEWDL